MKRVFFILGAFVGGSLNGWAAADPSRAEAEKNYQAFVQQSVTPENLADTVAKMDAIIDQTEEAFAASGQRTPVLGADVRDGLHLEFSIAASKEAVVYEVTASRKGLEFGFSDATKFIALFGDRAGLPHPIIVSEAGAWVYRGQWLIKPSDWKALKKKMIQVRTENRAEKEAIRAFVTAVMREMNARSGQ